MYVRAYDDIIAVPRFHQDDGVQGSILPYPASQPYSDIYQETCTAMKSN